MRVVACASYAQRRITHAHARQIDETHACVSHFQMKIANVRSAQIRQAPLRTNTLQQELMIIQVWSSKISHSKSGLLAEAIPGMGVSVGCGGGVGSPGSQRTSFLRYRLLVKFFKVEVGPLPVGGGEAGPISLKPSWFLSAVEFPWSGPTLKPCTRPWIILNSAG